MNKIVNYYKELFTESINKYLLSISLILFSIYISLLIPQIRSLTITTTEFLLGRSISFDHWNAVLLTNNKYLLLIGIFLIVSVSFNLARKVPKLIISYNNAFHQKKWVRILSISIPWIAIILSFSLANLDNPDFWWDEIDQFWISKGQNPYSMPNTATGNLSAVIKNNTEYNLDPGGLSVILRFWTAISNHQSFIRLLPLLFFILSMVVVTKIALIWHPDNLLSYFAGFILFLSSLLKYQAFELRPYSMEMFTTILAVYWCLKEQSIFESKSTALIAGTSLAFCMTSRYSAILSVFIACLILFFKLLQRRGIKRDIYNYFLVIFPIIICGLLIYIFMLQYQNPGVSTPTYVDRYMLSTDNFSQILFNRSAIQTYGPFILLVLIQLLDKRNVTGKYATFIYYVILLNMVFAFTSILRLYPWSFITKWDISINSLFIISLLPLIYYGQTRFRKRALSNTTMQGLSAFVFIAITFFLASTYTYPGMGSISENFIECKVFDGEDAKVAGNGYAAPTVRYLFEYGPFKSHTDVYQNMAVFGENEIDSFDFILLQHWIDDSYDIMQKINRDENWKLCSQNKYSRMYVHNQ